MNTNNIPDNQQTIQTPESIHVQESTYELTVDWRWSRSSGTFIVIFAIIWNGILFGIYAEMYASNVPLVTYLFPLIHLLIGLIVGYVGLLNLVNKTIVTANRNELSISHKPLPWFGAKVVNRINIKQLYVVEVITKTKHGYSTSYAIKALDQNSKPFDVVKGLPKVEMAKYLEQRIESFWKIENAPVQGEFNRL